MCRWGKFSRGLPDAPPFGRPAISQRVENTTMSEPHSGKLKSGPQTEFTFKSEIDYAIWCAVLGKPSPWRVDSNPKFKPEGKSFEDRFKASDKQILLWEFFDCWREGRRIPKWAGDALYDLLFRMAKGRLRAVKNRDPSWDDAFGKQYVGSRPGGQRTRSVMFDVYRRYEDLRKKNKAKPREEKTDTAGLYAMAGEPFSVDGDTAKILIRDVNRAINDGYRPSSFEL